MHPNLATLLAQMPSPTILVLGDLILDRYIWGDAERVSPEAPVLILRADLEEVRLGGAASVANLLWALDGRVILAGVLGGECYPGAGLPLAEREGYDGAGRIMRALLGETGIDATDVLADPERITTSKERFIGRAANRHANQILRVDREVRHALAANVEDKLIAAIVKRLDEAQVVLIADYAKGVCTPRLLRAVMQAAEKPGVPVFVDPARIADYERYRGASLLVPNRVEAEMATGQPINTPDDAARAGQALCDRYAVPMVIVKLDKDGMVLICRDGPTEHYPAKPRTVYDVTGAGDMVLAVVGLCQACGASWMDSVQLANAAAGLEVEQPGVVPVTRQEICADLMPFPPLPTGGEGPGVRGTPTTKIVTLPQLLPIAASLRRSGKKVVFTNGCFDLLHIGHVTYLQEASQLADVLVVGMNSDASVRRLKGCHRPVIRQDDRARMLASLACVDHVVIFDEDTPHAMLHALKPELLVKGGTYTVDEVVGHEIVESYGGHVEVLSVIEGISTTRIIGELTALSPLTRAME